MIILVYTTQAELLANQNITFGNQSGTGSRSVFLQLLGGEKYFANHLRVNQSEHTKSTIHFSGIC